ncbi:MAG TPA: hypothetical protein ENO05_07685 [Bacteroides sp.]|nr:hypothetical protein [Bacteroides sp.]
MKKNKKAIAFFSALIFSILFSLLFKWGQTGDPFRPETILYGTVVFVLVIILGGIASRSFQKFSNKPSAALRKNFLPYYILSVIMALVISIVTVSAGVYLFFLIRGLDTTHFLEQLVRVELPGAIKQFAIWILIGSAFFFYIIWRKAIDREQKLREENLKYRYRNLKAQVRPHFLFNSLNTISELVYEDAAKADQYIRELSGIYRYILDNEDTDLIPLERELEFVMKYFDLQKARDNDKIRLHVDIRGADRFRVIPVSVQMLVENALKHNARSEENPLEIHIGQSEGSVMVSNVIHRKSTLQSSPGTGLENLRERVKTVMGRELEVSEENDRFCVILPILEAGDESPDH